MCPVGFLPFLPYLEPSSFIVLQRINVVTMSSPRDLSLFNSVNGIRCVDYPLSRSEMKLLRRLLRLLYGFQVTFQYK